MEKQHTKRRFALLLGIVLSLLLPILCLLPARADIEWSGESGGNTGGSGTAATQGSFLLLETDYNDVVGYRFSLVNGEGELEKKPNGENTLVLDIYATTSKHWTRAGIDSYHGGIQYNKIDIQGCLQSSSTRNKVLSFKKGSENSQYNGALDKDIFTNLLPGNPTKIGKWAQDKDNLDPLVKKLGLPTGVAGLERDNNYVLVEPIFALNLEGRRCALTISEIALYGYQRQQEGILTATGNKGPNASACVGDTCTGCHFSFIAYRCTCTFPSFLYETEVGVKNSWWNAGSDLTARATFETILKGGYGVGIAWGASDSDVVVNTYTVSFSATPSGYGTVSKSSVTDVPYGSTISYSGNKATIKNAKSGAYNLNYTNYIATREGVEELPIEIRNSPTTDEQLILIHQLIEKNPDLKNSSEYESFAEKRTVGNASELISSAVEEDTENLQIYMNYIATRPRAERMNGHGLFSDEDNVNLEAAKEELGCLGKGRRMSALVDDQDVHVLMVGAAGVGKTACFLYPNLEYASAAGMSYVVTDTKAEIIYGLGNPAVR